MRRRDLQMRFGDELHGEQGWATQSFKGLIQSGFSGRQENPDW